MMPDHMTDFTCFTGAISRGSERVKNRDSQVDFYTTSVRRHKHACDHEESRYTRRQAAAIQAYVIH